MAATCTTRLEAAVRGFLGGFDDDYPSEDLAEAAVRGFLGGFDAIRAIAEAAEAARGGPAQLPRFCEVLALLVDRSRRDIPREAAQWLIARAPPTLEHYEALTLAYGAGDVRWYAWLDLAWRVPPADWHWFIKCPLSAARYALLGPAGPPEARRKLCALRGLVSERDDGCPENASSIAMVLCGRTPSWSLSVCFLPGVSAPSDTRRAILDKCVKDKYWHHRKPTAWPTGWLPDWVEDFLYKTGTELGLNDRDTGIDPEYFDPDVRDSLVLTLEDDMLGPTDGDDLYPYQRAPSLLRCRASAREFMRRRARAAWAAALGYVAWRAAAALVARPLGRRAPWALRYAAWAGPASF